MKEVVVHPLPILTTEIHEVPIPIPAPTEVVIKVIVAGSNVKDWLHITARNITFNSGDDMAGIVHALGSEVVSTSELKVGDRVAAFHPMLTPGGAYAEFAVAPQHTVFKLPDRTSFEEAATIPLVALTAALSLFKWQSCPPPWLPASEALPLIIYGASSALGSFAIKLARASNIHPIIAIGGASHEYASSLLDYNRGDAFIDYRQGPDVMKNSVKAALGDLQALHALDAISSNGTWIPLSQMLSPGGQVSVVSGSNTYDEPEIPAGIEIKYTYVGAAHTGSYLPEMPKQPADKGLVESTPEFAYVLFRYISRLLAKGTFEGHPFEVIAGGLGGVGVGLQKLKDGKAKGRKFVYRIAETDGI